MSNRLSLKEYVYSRMQVLGLSRSELARRCGFKNIAKTLRRIDNLMAGETRDASSIQLFEPLRNALEADENEFLAVIMENEARIDATTQEVQANTDKLWRQYFVPHGYMIGAYTYPSPLVSFILTGGPERWLKIRFDLSRSPITYHEQALTHLNQNVAVPFHGHAMGFVINYTPDCAIRFNAVGQPVEVFDRAYRPGVMFVTDRRRSLQSNSFIA